MGKFPKLWKTCSFLFFLPFVFWTNFAFGAYNEVKITSSQNGITYTIPAYSSLDGDYNPVPIESFYVKDEYDNEVIMTDMETKATLYGVSLIAYNFKKENYWKLRKHAELTYFALIDTIGDVRADTFKPGATLISIGISAAGGCAVGAAVGAVPGTIVPLFGTAAGAGAGCVAGALINGSAATIDEAGATAVQLIETYNDMSREEISKFESEKMLGTIYQYSCDIRAATANWLNNGVPITTDNLLQIIDKEIILQILTEGLTYYTHHMYPTSDALIERYEDWLQITIGWGFNCLEAADDGNTGWGGVPASTIMALIDYEADLADGQIDSEALLHDINCQLLAPELRNEFYEHSPISPINININKAFFESREPVEYSNSYYVSGNNLFSVSDSVQIRTVLQKLGQSYPDATVSYTVSDWKGNALITGQANYDGYYYSTTFDASENPGKYTVMISAKDSTGNNIGGSALTYTILNPAEGHDLSLVSCSSSRVTAQPGEHTVDIGFTITNGGMYQENLTAYLSVSGPSGYTFNSSSVSLGSLASGYTQQYSNCLHWSVPSSVIDGSYSLNVNVTGDVGDISPVNNSKELFVYVGNYNRQTPIAMVGKEVTLELDPDFELASYFDTPIGWGGFGWLNYTNNGVSYQIAVSGVLKNADRVNGEIGVVVKRNGTLIYSSGDIDEDVGEPIYILGTPLILYVYQSDSHGEEIGMVISESFSGIGFDVRERSSIPGIEVEYNTVTPNLSCTNNHTYIHQAGVNSQGEWNFNICWQVNDDITYNLAECDSVGRKIFLSSSTVKKHFFVVEHRSSSQPEGYAPQLSGYDSLQSYTYYWLTGILDVQNYNDISLAEISIPSQFSAGVVQNLDVQIQKEGTLTPDDILLIWSITGPNDYQFDKTTDGAIGVNSIDWDTNGLEAGQYTLSAKALSSGDFDTDDITIYKPIELTTPIPTEIIEHTVDTAFLVGPVPLDEAEPVVKEGNNYHIEIELIDSSGSCRKEGFAYARQKNSSSEYLHTSLLIKDSELCLYRGNFPMQAGAVNIEVVGHLNRHDDGDLVLPVTVTPNEAPIASLNHNYDSLEFFIPQTLTFYGSGSDPDGDGPLSFMWEVTLPDDSTEFIAEVDNINIDLTEAGNYQLTFYTIDGLGKQSSPQSITAVLNLTGADSDNDGLSDDFEQIICTDPYDADTDDDGILDGDEDQDHDGILGLIDNETHPCNPDSDNDGIQDGTEIGLTADDIGLDTDSGFFIGDADPTTVTDPKQSDTDNDGLLDGEEDENHNGRIDSGETDPYDIFISLTISLPAGSVIIENGTDSYPFSGTTSTNVGYISSVEYRINSGNWLNAQGTGDWHFTVIELQFGDNFIEVRSQNDGGFYSSIVSRIITREAGSVDAELIAHLKFDGDATDASLNANHGTFAGNAALTTDRLGNEGYACGFDGSGDYVLIPSSPSLQISDTLTVAAWVNIQDTGAHHTLAVQGTYFDTTGNWEIYISSDGKLQLPKNNTSLYSISDGAITFGNWHHVAVTFSAGTTKFYIDGQLDSIKLPGFTSFNTTSDGIKIGEREYTSGSGDLLGKIDDVRIYSRALSDAEILEISNSSSSSGIRAMPWIPLLLLDE